jgi:type I restriction enzyme S subunit
MKEHKRFDEVFDFLPKSKNQASIGAKIGQYPFYTSSPIISKFVDYADLTLEDSLVFGTGGNPSIHYARGGFSISTDCYAVKPKDSSVLTKFAYHYLSGNIHILQNGFKGAGLKHISKSYIQEISIPVLPLPQQKKIVSVLDTASALVEKQKALLKKYDLFLKSKFIEMFGDPVLNPMGWEFTSLKNFGKIITGNTPPRQIDEYYNDDFIEWVKTDNIKSENMYVGQAAEYLSESGMKKARTLESGALLITCIAGSLKSIGTSCLTNRKISFNQQINAIQPHKDINPFFLYVLFKISKTHIQTFATSSMKKIITKGEFETIKLIKPPYDLQNQFSQIVEQTEILKQKEPKI